MFAVGLKVRPKVKSGKSVFAPVFNPIYKVEHNSNKFYMIVGVARVEPNPDLFSEIDSHLSPKIHVEKCFLSDPLEKNRQ